MRKAFTVVELLVLCVFTAIIAAALVPVVQKMRQRPLRDIAPIRQEPVDAPSTTRSPSSNSYKFYVTDGVLAAEISQVLSTNGFEVHWLDDQTVAVMRR